MSLDLSSRALPAARALMATTVTIAALLTTGLPFIFAVQLAYGVRTLSVLTALGVVAPIAGGWACFALAVAAYRRAGGA